MSYKHPKMLLNNMRLGTDKVEDTIKEIIISYQFVKDNPVLYQAHLKNGLVPKCYWYQTWIRQKARCCKLRRVFRIQPLVQFRGLPVVVWVLLRLPVRNLPLLHCQNRSRTQGNQGKPILGSCVWTILKPQVQELQNKSGLQKHSARLLRVTIQKVRGVGLQPENRPHLLHLGTRIFRLGYISYSNPVTRTMGHHTSCHLIQDQWFHYDGLNYCGQLKKIDEPNYLPANFTPQHALYFKIKD